MKTIRILWLYGDLLDLYGDRGNLTALTYRLRELNVPYTVEEKSLFDTLELTDYQLIYVGPGKDRNLLRAAAHLAQYADSLRQAVENDTVVLCTGNAQLLFGRSITDEQGHTVASCGLFDYTGELTGEVFTADMVATPVFDPGTPLYAFINRTSRLHEPAAWPLFRVKYASRPVGETEGILYRNFMGTWALGPVLAKNPALLREVLVRLLGQDVSFDSALQDTALERTLAEFPQSI